MAEIQRSSAPGFITPPHTRSSSSHYLTAPAQNIPIQTTNLRSNGPIGPLSPVNQNGSYAFDRVIKSGQVHRRMKKKGAWRSSWKPAYLVLRPNLLSVYKDHDETELRASITLSDVTAVAPVKKSNHDHVFGVFSPSKNYHFAGLSAREAADWISIIRFEALTDTVEDVQPPSTSLKQSEPQPGYETTDLSADDDLDVPGSPEVPHWAVRGNKARDAPYSRMEPRTTSGMTGYSGNESFATSQSDFSDAGFSTSGPGSKGYLSSSIPTQPSTLSPILDDVVPASRPLYSRGTTNFSDHNLGYTPASQTATPKAMPRSNPTTLQTPLNTTNPADPSRIIRQGHLRLAKTISGVKQWKTIWVTLRAQSLSFYKSSSEPIPTVTMPITSIIEAAEIDRKKNQHLFQIICEEKIWKLQTETEDELESWLGGLKSVLVRLEAERERERGSRNASISLPGLPQGLVTGQGQAQGQLQGQTQAGDGKSTQQIQSQSQSHLLALTQTLTLTQIPIQSQSQSQLQSQSPPSREGEHHPVMTSAITMAIRGVSLENSGSTAGSSGTRRAASPELSRA